MSPIKSIAPPGPMTTASVSPALASCSISSTTGAIQACGGGGMTPNSSFKVTHISKQCFVLRQPNGSLWTGDHVGELGGEPPSSSISCWSAAPWASFSAWPSA